MVLDNRMVSLTVESVFKSFFLIFFHDEQEDFCWACFIVIVMHLK